MENNRNIRKDGLYPIPKQKKDKGLIKPTKQQTQKKEEKKVL